MIKSWTAYRGECIDINDVSSLEWDQLNDYENDYDWAILNEFEVNTKAKMASNKPQQHTQILEHCS